MGAWDEFGDAVTSAVNHMRNDPDPLNDRELADLDQYVLRILAATAQSSSLRLDPDRPEFLPILDSVRYLGASGPDIDYDVAALRPGGRYRISGRRGEATFVGIAVYAGAEDKGATAIVESVDVDRIVAPDGTFVYEFQNPEAARVIVRQYFHDRDAQSGGSWSIERLDTPASGTLGHPTSAEMAGRVANVCKSIMWNARLNVLWTPERRAHPNEFVRLSSDDIVAAIPNPDVVYSFAWWKRSPDEAVVIEFVPPRTDYWSLQLCDRWFQCQPDRRSNLHDRQVRAKPDGSVVLVIADGDPGHPNWLDCAGHEVGTAFFRWLHADIDVQPTCRTVKVADVKNL
jgi:hypothetical protein